MRKELFWDRQNVSSNTEIEKAINFGGFDFIEHVIKKYGRDQFIKVILNSRNLSRKAVNYWCLVYDIDRNQTKAFKSINIWSPLR